MRKLLNNPWFVATAALVAILMVGRSVLSALSGAQAGFALAADASATETGTAGETSAISLTPEAALKALVVPAAVRDPFAARPKPEAVLEARAQPDVVDRVRLSAIWTQGNATLVLVNERICEAGDEIGRIKIESASQEGVWVTHWQGRDFVSLGAEFVLNTPAVMVNAAGPLASAL